MELMMQNIVSIGKNIDIKVYDFQIAVVQYLFDTSSFFFVTKNYECRSQYCTFVGNTGLFRGKCARI